jgi:SEC-C motif-containing protein
MSTCPCGSGASYAECCEPFITGKATPETAEQLMRSRYSAFVNAKTDYIFETTHPEHRADYDHKTTQEWAEHAVWEGLKVVGAKAGGPKDEAGEVEFIVNYVEGGLRHFHHELGAFKRFEGKWYFVDGAAVSQRPVVRVSEKLGRNDPCSCGSGKKYKKCCGQ